MSLSTDDSALLSRAGALLDARDFETALSVVRQRFDRGVDAHTLDGAHLAFRLAGTLIDIGSESKREDPVREGLRIVEASRGLAERVVGTAHLEYVLGNAKDALFDALHHERSFVPTPGEIDLLIEAKNHFWRAYREVSEGSAGLWVQLCVNLGNTLRKSFRIVEALQFYDAALSVTPSFGPAHINRAITLGWLELVTGSVTKNQLSQTVHAYELAAESPHLPPFVRAEAANEAATIRERLRALGPGSDGADAAATLEEEEAHPPYRKLLLRNHLSLSEHGLICHCAGARKDELTVPGGSRLGGSAIPRMELVTNRLKAEYSLARFCFYKGTRGDRRLEERFDPVSYTELMETECIGLVPEMLRTSVRLCFGILDKIAHGLCDFFGWVPPDEHIYFHSMWSRNGKGGRRGVVDWKRVGSIRNPAIVGLYSQATDLSAKNGEWASLREWRNCLEHGMLLVTEEPEPPTDWLGLRSGPRSITTIGEEEFSVEALRLLQFTRAAIFGFVFAMRLEGIREAAGDATDKRVAALRPKTRG